ncbi:MAG TPA: hypothetical protein VFE62_10820 [Gemmataceae bacterium]|nr:hypothetical protein [Gemmataceae bacterium]
MASTPDDDLAKRLMIAKELLEVFRFERMAYISATLLAVAVLLTLAVILLFRGSWELALGMFGASGVIGYSIGQLLRMWNQVLACIFNRSTEAKP